MCSWLVEDPLIYILGPCLCRDCPGRLHSEGLRKGSATENTVAGPSGGKAATKTFLFEGYSGSKVTGYRLLSVRLRCGYEMCEHMAPCWWCCVGTLPEMGLGGGKGV